MYAPGYIQEEIMRDIKRFIKQALKQNTLEILEEAEERTFNLKWTDEHGPKWRDLKTMYSNLRKSKLKESSGVGL